MFEPEAIRFYQKMILCQRRGGRFSVCRPFFSGGECWVDFIFTVGTHEYSIKYSCTNISPENAVHHSKNIIDIYCVCVEDVKAIPAICPIYCSECGKLAWSNEHRNKQKREMCQECRRNSFEEILKTTHGHISYVYLITDKSRNMVKIGTSNNPDQRLSRLQTGNGGQLVLSGLILGGRKLEREIHKMFNEKRIKNEWFSDCEEIREFFANYRVLERDKKEVK